MRLVPQGRFGCPAMPHQPVTRGRFLFWLPALLLAGCAHFEPRPLAPADIATGIEQRTLAAPELRAYLQTNLQRELVPWPPAKWDEEMLTLAAFYYHPSLDVARAQWGVARAGVRTAGGRPNPVASVTPGYSLNPQFTSPWFPAFSLDIPVETAGKRGYRIARAEQLSEAARLNLAAVAWQVRSQLRSSLLEYAAARQRADLLEQQLRLQEEIVALLQQRLQAGALARTELTLPRIALARANADFAEAARQAAASRVRVAEALGLAAAAIANVEFTIPLTLSQDAGLGLTSAQARRQALLSRPDILSALSEYAASESALQLEIAKQYPDVHLSPGYQFDEGDHRWSLGLSLELPVLNRNQGPIAEAKAKRAETAARFLALQAAVIAQIDSALAARAAALDALPRQDRLTQLAREQATAAQALFQAGAADRLELVSAQLEARTSELALLAAQFKARLAITQLEAALQLPLAAWPAPEQGRPDKPAAPPHDTGVSPASPGQATRTSPRPRRKKRRPSHSHSRPTEPPPNQT